MTCQGFHYYSWGLFWLGIWSDQKIMTANMFLVMRQKDFSLDQDLDFIRTMYIQILLFFVSKYLQCIYIHFTVKDENILTFKTVNFLSFHFKIICLPSPPSLTRARLTEILGCSLVRPNVKIGHRPERQNS